MQASNGALPPAFYKQSKGFMFLVVLLVLFALITPNASAQTHHKHHECDRVCGSIRYMHRIVRPYSSKLDRMAQCESGSRWYINTRNGFYGGLQFNLKTWWSVGGIGYPHQNSKLVQKYRAVKLIRIAGYGPWPVCGYR